jgi:hypothetical protein
MAFIYLFGYGCNRLNACVLKMHMLKPNVMVFGGRTFAR